MSETSIQQRLHDLVYERKSGDLPIRRISRSVESSIVKASDESGGYHSFGNDWWTNPECPLSYKYLELDPLYPPFYFESGAHPDEERASNLYEYMQDSFKTLFGKNFASILELGTGGGEITSEFKKADLDHFAVEGTKNGCQKLLERGVPKERVIYMDLRRLPFLRRKFDIVMCTEVAEHIEPFFASKVVENCAQHAPVVWFSAANRNRAAHYHHINEQDIEVWDNLFAFFGFPIAVQLDGRLQRADRIYVSEQHEGTIQFTD